MTEQMFLKNSCEMHVIPNKTFKVNNSVSFSIFMTLCNHLFHVVPRHLTTSKIKSHAYPAISHFLQPLVTAVYSVTMDGFHLQLWRILLLRTSVLKHIFQYLFSIHQVYAQEQNCPVEQQNFKRHFSVAYFSMCHNFLCLSFPFCSLFLRCQAHCQDNTIQPTPRGRFSAQRFSKWKKNFPGKP